MKDFLSLDYVGFFCKLFSGDHLRRWRIFITFSRVVFNVYVTQCYRNDPGCEIGNKYATSSKS